MTASAFAQEMAAQAASPIKPVPLIRSLPKTGDRTKRQCRRELKL
jgi:hypothetical protein